MRGVAAAPLGLGPEPERHGEDVEHLGRAVALGGDLQHDACVALTAGGAESLHPSIEEDTERRAIVRHPAPGEGCIGRPAGLRQRGVEPGIAAERRRPAEQNHLAVPLHARRSDRLGERDAALDRQACFLLRRLPWSARSRRSSSSMASRVFEPRCARCPRGAPACFERRAHLTSRLTHDRERLPGVHGGARDVVPLRQREQPVGDLGCFRRAPPRRRSGRPSAAPQRASSSASPAS